MNRLQVRSDSRTCNLRAGCRDEHGRQREKNALVVVYGLVRCELLMLVALVL